MQKYAQWRQLTPSTCRTEISHRQLYEIFTKNGGSDDIEFQSAYNKLFVCKMFCMYPNIYEASLENMPRVISASFPIDFNWNQMNQKDRRMWIQFEMGRSNRIIGDITNMYCQEFKALGGVKKVNDLMESIVHKDNKELEDFSKRFNSPGHGLAVEVAQGQLAK